MLPTWSNPRYIVAKIGMDSAVLSPLSVEGDVVDLDKAKHFNI